MARSIGEKKEEEELNKLPQGIYKKDSAGRLVVNVEEFQPELSISGTVSVDNFPSEYPLPDSQVSDLKNVYITGGTIDTVTAISETVSISIKEDSVGLAKESTLQEIVTNTNNIDVPISSLVRIRVYEQTFEDGTTDTTAENCTQEVQSDQVYAGNYSLKVTISAGQTGTITTPARPVSANQRVTFSFAHKEEGDITDVKLIVIWRRSSGGIISTEEYTLTPSASWQVDSRTVVAPKQAASMELRMQATAGSSEGYVYLDEMVMDLVGQILRVDGAGNVMVSVENTPLDVNVINTSLTVSGTVSVDNFPSEYPLPSSQISDLKSVTIEGSNIAYDSTADRLKVELPYDARDRNWALSSSTDSVSVTGSVSVSGTVNVGNFPSTYPLPETQVDEDTYFTGFVWDPSTSQFVRIEGYISNAEYGYDANGNLTSETLTITDASGTTIATIQKTYTYDAYGNLIGESKWEKV